MWTDNPGTNPTRPRIGIQGHAGDRSDENTDDEFEWVASSCADAES